MRLILSFFKSLLASLFQREAKSPLWKRGARGDFYNSIKQASARVYNV
jgi:hypothetical protein